MAINLVIAVTDDDWFEMLRHRPDITEVNFWAPSAANFRALQPGELFLFKLHAPRNVIVGGGIFAHANAMPWSMAWSTFGEANGARSAQEMRTRIATQPSRMSGLMGATPGLDLRELHCLTRDYRDIALPHAVCICLELFV